MVKFVANYIEHCTISKKNMDDFLVFDLETQRSAQDVGGWGNIAEMKISVGVVWDSRKGRFFTYYEEKVTDLITHLKSGPLVVGFNHIGFDYVVLSGYYNPGAEREHALQGLTDIANLDLLVDLKERVGKRTSLNSLARATLKKRKSADGMLALKWYKDYLNGDRGKLKKIADYCRTDVEVTRDLYLYGKENGKVYYIDKVRGVKKIEVDWNRQIDRQNGPRAVQLSF